MLVLKYSVAYCYNVNVNTTGIPDPLLFPVDLLEYTTLIRLDTSVTFPAVRSSHTLIALALLNTQLSRVGTHLSLPAPTMRTCDSSPCPFSLHSYWLCRRCDFAHRSAGVGVGVGGRGRCRVVDDSRGASWGLSQTSRLTPGRKNCQASLDSLIIGALRSLECICGLRGRELTVGFL